LIIKNPTFLSHHFLASLSYHLQKNLLDNELIIDNLPAGHYFYRVFIKDKYNNTSDAFDIYYDRATLTYCYGVKDFYSN
jgi:hypothetical protein